MKSAKYYETWAKQDHPDLFSGWVKYPIGKLVRLTDQFNESQFFRSIVGDSECQTISEIGCATGRYYRYLSKVWPSLEYKGYDISDPAIIEAKNRFPKGHFSVFDGSLKSVTNIESDIVWSRDVVHHQTNPREFLSDLYDITRKYLILRVRTREVGSTVYDPEQSCQYAYGQWVPFIVFNTSDLIELVSSFKPTPEAISLRRHPEPLGGVGGRYLPKELYYAETGTAFTAILIRKGED